jgi:hypothetical protein
LDAVSHFEQIRAGRDLKSGNVKHLSNSFLSDLSKALRNGFQSSFSIPSAIRNEGIVLPIYPISAATLPILNIDGKDTSEKGIIISY